jgi:hypothetical protein
LAPTRVAPATPPIRDAESRSIPPSVARCVPIGERVTAGAVAVACLAVLTTAALLRPDPAGHGTHESMGLPPCGVATAFDFPCLTCGMTTSFAHAANGELGAAFLTQPFGAGLAIAAASAAWIAAYVAATGSTIGRLFGRALLGRGLWGILALAIAAWAFTAIRWRMT